MPIALETPHSAISPARKPAIPILETTTYTGLGRPLITRVFTCSSGEKETQYSLQLSIKPGHEMPITFSEKHRGIRERLGILDYAAPQADRKILAYTR